MSEPYWKQLPPITAERAAQMLKEYPEAMNLFQHMHNLIVRLAEVAEIEGQNVKFGLLIPGIEHSTAGQVFLASIEATQQKALEASKSAADSSEYIKHCIQWDLIKKN